MNFLSLSLQHRSIHNGSVTSGGVRVSNMRKYGNEENIDGMFGVKLSESENSPFCAVLNPWDDFRSSKILEEVRLKR